MSEPIHYVMGFDDELAMKYKFDIMEGFLSLSLDEVLWYSGATHSEAIYRLKSINISAPIYEASF